MDPVLEILGAIERSEARLLSWVSSTDRSTRTSFSGPLK